MTDDNGELSGTDPGDIALDAEIVALLADESMWQTPSADLGDRIADAVASEAGVEAAEPLDSNVVGITRRSWIGPALLGAAAAFLLLIGGVVVLSAISGSEDQDVVSAELISTGLIADVEGTIEITEVQSGLRIDLEATGLPRRDGGAFYEGWLRTSNDRLIPVGTFHGGEGVIMWAGIELDDVVAFTITIEESAGPTDPGQGSSGEVVLRVAL